MQREIITTEGAPKPVGPYSQGVSANGFVFVAGQLGTEPESGAVPEGIEEQTMQALTNVKSILEAAGSSLERVVRMGIFLRDINDFAAMNKIYSRFFQSQPPVRTTVQAGLPGKYLVEIDAIALKE